MFRFEEKKKRSRLRSTRNIKIYQALRISSNFLLQLQFLQEAICENSNLWKKLWNLTFSVMSFSVRNKIMCSRNSNIHDFITNFPLFRGLLKAF